MKKRILAASLTLALALATTHTAFAAAGNATYDSPTSTGGITIVDDSATPVNGGLFLYTQSASGLSGNNETLRGYVADHNPSFVLGGSDSWDGADGTTNLENWFNGTGDDAGEIAADTTYIAENYGTGASIDFGTFNATAVTAGQTYQSSENVDNGNTVEGDEYVDVIVYDLNTAHKSVYADENSKEGWELSLTRGAFLNGENALDVNFGLTEVENENDAGSRTFHGNTPAEDSFDGTITGAASTVAKGSLGYVAKKFDASMEFVTADNLVDGQYQATLTWNLMNVPIGGVEG